MNTVASYWMMAFKFLLVLVLLILSEARMSRNERKRRLHFPLSKHRLSASEGHTPFQEQRTPDTRTKKRVAVAAVITKYQSAGNPSRFRDSLVILIESILDVATRSKWELVPVALCMAGQDNVPEHAVSELENLGFVVKMEDAVVERADIAPVCSSIEEEHDVTSVCSKSEFIKEVERNYTFGGVLRDYLKLRVLQWTEYDRVLVLDSDTM